MTIQSLIFNVIFVYSAGALAQINPGLWSTQCLKGLIKSQTLGTNNEIRLSENFYQDAACTQASFEFKTNGAVFFNSEQPLFIDFVYEDIQMTLYKNNLVVDFNSRKVCGFDNWKIAEPQDITGRLCAIFNIGKETQIPRRNDFKYGIYSIENEKLYYGKLSSQFDGNSPEKRPQQLNRIIEYIFQKSF